MYAIRSYYALGNLESEPLAARSVAEREPGGRSRSALPDMSQLFGRMKAWLQGNF